MDLSRTLIHRAQLERVSNTNDGWGGVEHTSAATVSCFLQGVDVRRVASAGQEIQVDFEVWVSASTSIAVNDAVRAVVAPDGETLLDSGRVVSVQRHVHPTRGAIATRALIVRN